jgi:hypothetical protein
MLNLLTIFKPKLSAVVTIDIQFYIADTEHALVLEYLVDPFLCIWLNTGVCKRSQGLASALKDVFA